MSGIVSSIFGGGSSGGSSASQQQTVTNEPPNYLQPFLATAAGNSQNAYQQYIAQQLNQPYTGAANQTAPNISALTPQPTAATIAGENTALNTANNMTGQQTNTNNLASGLQSAIANGMFSAPSSGEYAFQPMSDADLAASIKGQLAPLQQNLTQQILPQLQSQAINQGAYGGSRANVMNNMALESYDTAATNATAQATEQFQAQNASLKASNLASEMQAATTGNAQTLNALGEVPALQNVGTAQGSTQAGLQSAVGQTQQAQEASNIAANMQYYSGQQAAPFGGLGELESLLQGTNSGGTSTNSVPNAGLLSQITNGLSGLVGANSALSGIFGGGGGASGFSGGAVANAADPLAGAYGVSGTVGSEAAMSAADSSGIISGGSGILDALMALFA